MTTTPLALPLATIRQNIHALPDEELIAELVSRYPETDRVRAVLDVAIVAGIGVSWEDRETVQSTFEVTFTDEEWARIADQLQDWDETLGLTSVDECQYYALLHTLQKAEVDLEVVEARCAGANA